MKKIKNVLAMLVVVGLSGFMMAGACDDANPVGDLCGPCGTVENGDATITGNAEVDGVFKAVGTMKMRTGSLKADFDARVRAIAEGVFDLDTSAMATTDDVVAAIETEFTAWIDANVEGSIKVAYQPPKCEANVDVAVSAQAQCEAKADCNVEVECEPGKASFECEGKCEGKCEGGCEADAVCTVKIEGTAECQAECHGSCKATLDVAAECNGKCEGSCTVNGSTESGFNGTCGGECEGTCTMEGEAALDCDGDCSGECKTSGVAEADCKGSISCNGECSGSCSGSCQGEVKAPKCEGNAECDASAECEAQASAQASASLSCTPPSLKLDVAFKAGLGADAQAEFLAKLEKFKVEMIGILQGMANLRALVDADYASEMGITPPISTLTASIDAVGKAVTNGSFEVKAPGMIICAADALADSVTILGKMAGDASATISGQIKMAALIKL